MARKNQVEEVCPDCGGADDICPNCGGAEFQREFHAYDYSVEVFCAKCGFVVFG